MLTVVNKRTFECTPSDERFIKSLVIDLHREDIVVSFLWRSSLVLKDFPLKKFKLNRWRVSYDKQYRLLFFQNKDNIGFRLQKSIKDKLITIDEDEKLLNGWERGLITMAINRESRRNL